MSKSTKQHYENHLAEFYSWMFGDFGKKMNEASEFFINHGIKPEGNSSALDLGSGSGLQSIPLAELGFKVTAVDFSSKLLNELNSRKNNLEINSIEADLTEFEKYSAGEFELIVCMGDTLTHLNSVKDIEQVFKNCFKLLTEKGKFIISYRDLSNELTGENRFIPVRNTDNTIFTCFLEYGKDYVTVNDIINRKVNGRWQLKVSSYNKLRLPAVLIKHLLEDTGFKINEAGNSNGFIFFICSKR